MGLLNINGKPIINFDFSEIEAINTEFYRVGRIDKGKKIKFALFDKLGSQLSDFIYDKIIKYNNKLSAVFVDEKLGFLNQDGADVVPVIFDTYKIQPGSTDISLSNENIVYVLDHEGNFNV